MMEKEIVSVGKREDKLIRFRKSDNARVGRVYVLYPEELEELQKQIADSHNEIITLRNKIAHDNDSSLDDIVMEMINKMDKRVSRLESDVLKLK